MLNNAYHDIPWGEPDLIAIACGRLESGAAVAASKSGSIFLPHTGYRGVGRMDRLAQVANRCGPKRPKNVPIGSQPA
jgi:hypothetical protein